MCQENDTYRTVASPAEAVFKDRGSKFLAFSYHVVSAEEAMSHVEELRKKFYDATHHCFAYRLGPDGGTFRANDDGEPSGTAGRPILGQLLSNDVTDCLIVVVRYFGGTKLGVPGLINAYRESAAAVIAASVVEERTVDSEIRVDFSYMSMNEVMKTVKEMQPRIVKQRFDNLCSMTLAVRRGMADALVSRLHKIEGAAIVEQTHDEARE